MKSKRFVTWMAAAIASLVVAIAFPFFMSTPVTAQTAPPTLQVTTKVTYPGATANLKVYAAISLLEILTDIIDNVSVVELEDDNQQSTSVPEPSVMVGVAALGVIGFRTCGSIIYPVKLLALPQSISGLTKFY
jgi:hypothetical protein